MTAITLGPLVLAGDRLAAILGIVTFLLVSALLSRRVDRRVDKWSSHVLIAGLVAARLGHVIGHLDNFLAEPWRILAVWQGGFSPTWGIVAALLVTAIQIRSWRMAGATAAALGLSLFVWNAADRLAAASAGLPAPKQAMEQLGGPPMGLTDTGGKPGIVNIWATWCPPCRREMPLLAEIAASRDDVVFLFVNQGEGADSVRTYLDQSGLRLDHILLDKTMLVPRHYGTPGLPVTLFIRADGSLMTAHVGEISREILTESITRLLDPMP